jgi:hypothetical protein
MIPRTYRFMDTDNRLAFQRFAPGNRFELIEINALLDGKQEVVFRKLEKTDKPAAGEGIIEYKRK